MRPFLAVLAGSPHFPPLGSKVIYKIIQEFKEFFPSGLIEGAVHI